MMFVIVMGVSGCGKSVVGSRLAKRLNAHYAEGDEFHSEANVEKMRSGTPLTDEDRWPWLRSIATAIADWRDEGKDAVIACSALRKVYRDILADGHDDVVFAHLKGSMELISSRLSVRKHEYMPASLLKSQFDTLEEPDETVENAVTIDIDQEPEAIVAEIVDRLRAKGMIA
jgi:gluconokinase